LTSRRGRGAAYLSISVAAHINAVAPVALVAFTFAPWSRSSFIASTDPTAAACISGVAPPRGSLTLTSAPLASMA
jgi:hypothetical protein